MKQADLKKTLIVILFLICIPSLYAQKEFRPGYVITVSNDTIFGEIDYRRDLLMGERCKFKSDKDQIVDYFPQDIKAYRFTDGKYFVSREVVGKMVFLEFLIKGQLNVYFLRDTSGDHYYIDRDGMLLSELPYEEGLKIVNSKQVFYTTKTHIGILKYYTQDAPDINNQINQMKKPEHKELIQLAENYHHAVCQDGEECIIYEKRQPLFGLIVNAAVGVIKYVGHNNSPMHGGILIDIWMPRSGERLYFRTGLLFSQLTANKESDYLVTTQSIYKIPLMIEYVYPKSFVRPKAACGISLYNTSDLTFSLMAGVNIKLDERLTCLLEYNIDFSVGHAFIPRYLATQTFLGGLGFKF